MKSQNGLSLVETLIGGAVLAGLALAGVTLFENQSRNQNLIEFKSELEVLRLSLVSQMLSDPQQCKCLFNGATFAQSGHSELVSPEANLGRYQFTNPGDCSTATIPSPLASKNDRIGLVLDHIKLHDIQPVSGVYTAKLSFGFTNTKKSTGVKKRGFQYPVVVMTEPSGPGMVRLAGCSVSNASSSSMGSPLTFIKNIKNPTFPVTVDLPTGLKSLVVQITASQYINLPSDVGRTISTHYSYSSNISPTQTPFAVFSIGAGNNNGAQARLEGTTSGLIDLTTESLVTISYQNTVLGPSGNTICSAGPCGVSYQPKLITILGSME